MSNTSLVYRLKTELQEESHTRQLQQDVNSKLQQEHDQLLKRLAEAENHIDKLRLGGSVNLNKHIVITHESLSDRLGAQLDPSWRVLPTTVSDMHPGAHMQPYSQASHSTANACTGTDAVWNVSQYSEHHGDSSLNTRGQEYSNGESTLLDLENDQSPQHYTMVVHDRGPSPPPPAHMDRPHPLTNSDLSNDDDPCISQMSASSVTNRANAESLQIAHLFKIGDLQEKVTRLQMKLNDGGFSFDTLMNSLEQIQQEHRALREEVEDSNDRLETLNNRYKGRASGHIARSKNAIGDELATLSDHLESLQELLHSKAEQLHSVTSPPSSPLHIVTSPSDRGHTISPPLPSSSATESALHAQMRVQSVHDSGSEVSSDFSYDAPTPPYLPSKYLTKNIPECASTLNDGMGDNDRSPEHQLISHDILSDHGSLSHDQHSLSRDSSHDQESFPSQTDTSTNGSNGHEYSATNLEGSLPSQPATPDHTHRVLQSTRVLQDGQPQSERGRDILQDQHPLRSTSSNTPSTHHSHIPRAMPITHKPHPQDIIDGKAEHRFQVPQHDEFSHVHRQSKQPSCTTSNCFRPEVPSDHHTHTSGSLRPSHTHTSPHHPHTRMSGSPPHHPHTHMSGSPPPHHPHTHMPGSPPSHHPHTRMSGSPPPHHPHTHLPGSPPSHPHTRMSGSPPPHHPHTRMSGSPPPHHPHTRMSGSPPSHPHTTTSDRDSYLSSRKQTKPLDADSGLVRSTTSLNGRALDGSRESCGTNKEDYSSLTMSAIDQLRAELDSLKEQIRKSSNTSSHDNYVSHKSPPHTHSTHHYGSHKSPPHTHSTHHYGSHKSPPHTHSTHHYGSHKSPPHTHTTHHYGSHKSPPHTHTTHRYGSHKSPHPTQSYSSHTDVSMPRTIYSTSTSPIITSSEPPQEVLASPGRSVRKEKVTHVNIHSEPTSPDHIPDWRNRTPAVSSRVRSTPQVTPIHGTIVDNKLGTHHSTLQITPDHRRNVADSKMTTPQTTPRRDQVYSTRPLPRPVLHQANKYTGVSSYPNTRHAGEIVTPSRSTPRHTQSTTSSVVSTPHRVSWKTDGTPSRRSGIYTERVTTEHSPSHTHTQTKIGRESSEFKSPKHHPRSSGLQPYASSNSSGLEKSKDYYRSSRSSSLEGSDWVCPQCGGRGTSTVSISPSGTRTHVHTHKCTQVYTSPVHSHSHDKRDHGVQVDITRGASSAARHTHDGRKAGHTLSGNSFAQQNPVATSTPTKTGRDESKEMTSGHFNIHRQTSARQAQSPFLPSQTRTPVHGPHTGTTRQRNHSTDREDQPLTSAGSTPQRMRTKYAKTRFDTGSPPYGETHYKHDSRSRGSQHAVPGSVSTRQLLTNPNKCTPDHTRGIHAHTCQYALPKEIGEGVYERDPSQQRESKSRDKVVYVSSSPSDREEPYHSEPGSRGRDHRRDSHREMRERKVVVKKSGSRRRKVYVRPESRQKVYVVGGGYSGSDSDSGPDLKVIEGPGLDLNEALRLASNLKRRSRKMHGSLRELMKMHNL